IAEFILLYTLHKVHMVTRNQYMWAYCTTLMVSIILRFGVIDEISGDLFRESPFLKVSARRTLQWTTGFLLPAAVLLAVYAPGSNSAQWYDAIFVVNRGAAMVQCGLLLALLAFFPLPGIVLASPRIRDRVGSCRPDQCRSRHVCFARGIYERGSQ